MPNFSKVYVVRRAGRRIEPENYKSKQAASDRASQLYMVLKQWGDSDMDKIDVIYTAKPNQIR